MLPCGSFEDFRDDRISDFLIDERDKLTLSPKDILHHLRDKVVALGLACWDLHFLLALLERQAEDYVILFESSDFGVGVYLADEIYLFILVP